MAETKNVFLGAKMNKDLDPRLISNREYIEARNASVTDSAGGDSGVLENVFGNSELTTFGLTDSHLKIIGFYVDTANDRLFAFLTNYTDSSATALDNYAPGGSAHYIAMYNTINGEYTILVGGSFLNFSDTHEVLGIDLIENLLFFTDNRNQPRKINVDLAIANPYGSANPYYTSEEHISVAKYYPYQAPSLSTLKGDGSIANGTIIPIDSTVIITGVAFPTSAIFTVGVTSGVTTDGSGGTLTCNVTTFASGTPNTLYVGSIFVAVAPTDVNNNYVVGDKITITAAALASFFGGSASGDATFTISRQDFARTPSMWDVVSENLPLPFITFNLFSGTTTVGYFTIAGGVMPDSNYIGATITSFVISGGSPPITVADGVTVTAINSPSPGDVTVSDPLQSFPPNSQITIGANPYYDPNFTGDKNFLSDKFARFSYRYKFEDNEYSLIAPFSQAAFIPKQDGYFLEESIPTSILDDAADSDENNTIKSTIIDFFENKVNKIDIAIPMPDDAFVSNTLAEGNGVLTSSITTNQIDFVTGIYSGTVGVTAGYSSSGSGIGLEINISVVGGSVVDVSVVSSGSGYMVGDTVTVLGSVLGGVTGNLVITLQSSAFNKDSIYNKYKVKEIDVLFKDSEGNAIKVVDTIDFDDLALSTGTEYVYTYNSSKPIRTLPSKETIRVSDQVPLRARAQAVAGNRVIYGNLTLKSASLTNLNYSIAAGDKLDYGFGGPGSKEEYPNHSLKQNRTYQVGIVLADKYGRQSDVITSDTSTIYHPYKDDVMDLDFLGDSLQATFNAPIPSVSSTVGYIGLYDATTNPLGWYSYKFVVKQQEQSYYNVYLPTILNGYPQDVRASGPTVYTTVRDEAYITLFSDNVNKIPRDLQEVGPQDLQFSSSVRVFGRVYNTTFDSSNPTNKQYFPTTSGDEVTLIGDRNEIGLDTTSEGDEYYSSPFYSIPTNNIGTIAGDGADLRGANPYIGRVSTVNLIGAVGGGDLTVSGSFDPPEVTNLNTRLNVYETAPFVSNLEIFWESTSSGLISTLNSYVKQDFSELPVSIANLEWDLSEDAIPPSGFAVTEIARFDLAAANGEVINNATTTATLVEVRNGNGGIVTNKFTLNRDNSLNQFYMTPSPGTYFVYTQNSRVFDNYSFTISATNNSGPASLISTGFGNYLANVEPTATATGSASLPEIIPPSTWATFTVMDGDNGAAQVSDQKNGLIWEVTKIEFQWTGNGGAWTEYNTPVSDMFRVVKGSGQSIPETLQYNNQLICLDVNATNEANLYNYSNRVDTDVRVTLNLTDASGSGLSYETVETTTLTRTN
jgi:hypothetical protein